MVIKTKYDYDFDGKKGTSYKIIVDGIEYKVDEKVYNKLDGIELIERRFYDKDKQSTRISYTI